MKIKKIFASNDLNFGLTNLFLSSRKQPWLKEPRTMKKLFTFYTILLLLVTSCSPIMGIYGIRAPKELSEKRIYNYSNRHSIPENEIYQLDTSYYSFLLSLDTIIYDTLSSDELPQEKKNIKNQIKNHYQPLQALYFNKSGRLVSFQINCYAGGFPNLEWDRDNILTSFPPKVQAPLDSLVTDSTLLKYLLPMSNSSEVIIREYDYVIFVFWSKFMGRQNKRFIQFIQENNKLSAENNVKFVYINMDNFYVLNNIW